MSDVYGGAISTYRLTSPGGGNVIAAPASGATVTLHQSTQMESRRVRRLILNLRSSHISAVDGLTLETRYDNAGTWRIAFSYTHPAATTAQPFVRYVFDVTAPYLRIRYTNSANTLTEWEGSLDVDNLDL